MQQGGSFSEFRYVNEYSSIPLLYISILWSNCVHNNMADHHLLVLQSKPKSYLPLSYLLLLLLHPLPIVSYFSVPDLSLDNVNTAIQLTQILYKASSPYSENLQWGSFYDETFWESESSDEEYEAEADGWEWMSDFSVDTWLPNWSA